jgi:hypothetical protein
VPGMIHATAASGWSLSGSVLTFAFPMALIIIAATVLYYVMFSRPHRVPGHKTLAFAQPVPPDPGTAQAMAAAAGLPTAAGGGITTLAHEPHGAEAAAEAAAEDQDTPDAPSSDGPETSA